jgi:hypothetical protein
VTSSYPDLSTTTVGTPSADHPRVSLAAVAEGLLPADLCGVATRRLTAAGSVPANVE